MNPDTITGRIRSMRMQRNLTQQQFADALGRSLAWVKKLEAGDRQADPRISVLQQIAAILGVPLSRLIADSAPSAGVPDDTALLRAALLAPARATQATTADHLVIARQAEYGFSCFQAGHYATLLALLPDLVTDARTLPDTPAAARAAYRVHHLAANALMKFSGGPAAWHAAGRAVDFARASGDPVALALAAQTVTYTMISIGEARTGLETAACCADDIAGSLTTLGADGHTALGMLYLKAAVAAADCADNPTATTMLANAARCAQHVPLGANLMLTGFDDANVLLHQVSVHAQLARFGQAAQAAERIPAASLAALPRERRAHHLIETAATYAVLGRDLDALTRLLRAEADSPQEVRSRPAARAVIADLVHRGTGPTPARLKALAQRAGVES